MNAPTNNKAKQNNTKSTSKFGYFNNKSLAFGNKGYRHANMYCRKCSKIVGATTPPQSRSFEHKATSQVISSTSPQTTSSFHSVFVTQESEKYHNQISPGKSSDGSSEELIQSTASYKYLAEAQKSERWSLDKALEDSRIF